MWQYIDACLSLKATLQPFAWNIDINMLDMEVNLYIGCYERTIANMH